jgi:hypothetical protein
VLAAVRLLAVALRSSLSKLLTLPAQCLLRRVLAHSGLLGVILSGFGVLALVLPDRGSP